jgi:predicted alpha-1,2-mannosidase
MNKTVFIIPAILVLFPLGFHECTDNGNRPGLQEFNAVQWVDPLIGTAGSRWFFFSSACRPFGMVNLSPDTRIDGAWGSGYRYGRDTIVGFSHIHAWQLAGISAMPVVGEVNPVHGVKAYESKFSHSNEIVRPGYHKVTLDRYNIRVELTSTTRVGFHRYTFPESGGSQFLFNLGGILGPSEMTDGMARIVNNREIEGYSVNGSTRRRPKEYPVYFVAAFNKPFNRMDGWQEDMLRTDIEQISGSNAGVMLRFNTGEDEEVLMKVGISYCSIEQARLNLETELNHWNFDEIVRDSEDEWNEWLSKIQVKGGTHDEKTRFYTDLWRSLQGRRIISDVNGKYADYTGDERRIRQLPLNENGRPLFNYYNSDSFWGAQWTLNTLWHLVYPHITEEFVNSMLTMYKDGGLIPRGPSGGNYTYVMTGASTTPFIVSAYMKGIRGFDVDLAYEGLKKNHLPGGIMSKAGYEHNTSRGGGLEEHIELGYVPFPLSDRSYGFHQDGAGQTLEYAYQDWCLAQMASALGRHDDEELFLQRSQNYRNLYDPSTGWMRPRTREGRWTEPFDPLAARRAGFVESNAAQMTWFVPHDIPGLAELMGGYDSLVHRLNKSFELTREYNFINNSSWTNYSNQPATQMAHIFNYANAPWLTQYWVRKVIEKTFSDVTPRDGYKGDEDQGLMGSLGALMKIGIFELHGGAVNDPFYELTSPIFDQITILLDQDYYSGEKFVIDVENNASAHYYIQSAVLNDQPLYTPFIPHQKVVDGGRLKLILGPEPKKDWGLMNSSD